MGIRVKHGEGDISALAGLAALAGATEARTPQAPQVSPQGAPRGGGGGGDRRSGVSRGPTLADYGQLHYPSDRERAAEAKTREMEYQQRLIKQEEAQKRAIPVDFKYTPKQRAKIAHLQNSKQQMQASERFSPQEKEMLSHKYDAEIDAIKPTGIPRDPNAPQYPEGRGPGDTFQEADGAWYTIDEKGVKKLLSRYDQTREGIEQKAAAAHDLKLLDLRHKLATEQIEAGIGKDGLPIKRYRTSEEIDERMAIISNEQPEVEYREDLEPVLRKMVADRKKGEESEKPKGPDYVSRDKSGKPKGRKYLSRARSMGIKTTEAEEGMPRDVGIAQAFLRTIQGRLLAGYEPSGRIADAIDEATAIVEWYAITQGEQGAD